MRCARDTPEASFHVIAVARDRIDHGDLLDREVGDDLDLLLMHDQHLLDAHAVTEALAVLGLERERHSGLDLDRVVERPDARDHRRIVLREAEASMPKSFPQDRTKVANADKHRSAGSILSAAITPRGRSG